MLWRIHRLHHTDQDFDFTVETGANLLVVLLVGAPPLSVMIYVLSYAITTVWVHGNIRMPDGWDARLRRILVTPDMHRTHHSQIQSETNSNYGGLPLGLAGRSTTAAFSLRLALIEPFLRERFRRIDRTGPTNGPEAT